MKLSSWQKAIWFPDDWMQLSSTDNLFRKHLQSIICLCAADADLLWNCRMARVPV